MNPYDMTEERHKGGILTLVRNSIPAIEVKKSIDEQLEWQTIKLIHPEGDLWITNCYSPPGTAMTLDKIKVETERHLVVGDFNSHSPS